MATVAKAGWDPDLTSGFRVRTTGSEFVQGMLGNRALLNEAAVVHLRKPVAAGGD